uniref:Uncharacterized protein n=1 Tax=Oryza brachyantha TaxID=4533 RepID=J3LNP7_ORYBR
MGLKPKPPHACSAPGVTPVFAAPTVFGAAPVSSAPASDLTLFVAPPCEEDGRAWYGCCYRAIQKTVGGFPRPRIDLSPHNFARVMDEALGYRLDPPFDPYVSSLNFLLAAYVIPYLGINGYTGTNPLIDGYATKRLGRICTNILSADADSLSYSRTPAELLRILYLTGDERKPGGFFPDGANGKIARSFLAKPPGVNH